MHSITDWLDRFCYKHPRLGIPNLMMYIVIGNIAVYLLDNFSGGAWFRHGWPLSRPVSFAASSGGSSPLFSSPPPAIT